MTKIDSKYSLVSVAAKRARQLQTTEATILEQICFSQKCWEST